MDQNLPTPSTPDPRGASDAAETRISAADCALAGLCPIDLRLPLEGNGFETVSLFSSGNYLTAAAVDGARFELLPAEGVTEETFAQWVFASLDVLAPVYVGAQGTLEIAGAPRVVVSALTLGGGVPVLHLAALVIDAKHAPHGVALMFRVPSHAASDPVPTPAEIAEEYAPIGLIAGALAFGTGAVAGRPAMLVPSAGARLSDAPSPRERARTPALRTPRPSTPVPAAELTFVEEGETRRHRLTGRDTLGRARDNTVAVADTMTSKHHATIEWDGERFVLTDLGSINGTRVDGHLARHPTPLRHGATIELGRSVMRFHELERRTQSGTQLLAAAFAHDGLPQPPLPPALAAKLRPVAPWFFATESLPALPLHGDLGVSLGGRDYLVICHGPPRATEPTLQYCLSLGPLRLALECAWRGSADPALARSHIAASFLGLRALMGAVEQSWRHRVWPAGVVLEVRALERFASFWSPVGAGEARRAPGAANTPCPDTLAEALAWVQAL